MIATAPKFAAQAIRKCHEIGWRPLHFLTNVSSSVGAVMDTAGAGRESGSSPPPTCKDPTDPAWANDPGMNEWRAFMGQYCRTATWWIAATPPYGSCRPCCRP